MNEKSSSQEVQNLLDEVLQDMVNENLLLVKATQDSIQIDTSTASDLEKQQFASLRGQYKSDEEFAGALQEYGISEPQLRYMIRTMIVNSQLQEKILQGITGGISVTPQDMDNWVIAHRDSLGELPAQYRMSHILRYVEVAESRKTQVRDRAQAILDRVKNGEDFAQLAQQYSEDPGSKTLGGDLGYFRREAMLPEFADAAFRLKPGEVSGIVETQFGYHIIKVEDVRGNEVHARHILLLLQPSDVDTQDTIALLDSIRVNILSGKVTFEDMAKKYSKDENSNSLGGRLQWLTAESGLESFITQAEKMKAGEISEPIKTQYGYHLLRLDGLRPAHKVNVKDDSQIIRQVVQNEKSMAELQRILEKLRAETYISISLN
jgi:peptidyl-prolyl cis-trans isomerase SurA